MPSVELATIAAALCWLWRRLRWPLAALAKPQGSSAGRSAALCVVVMLTGLLALIGNGPDTALTLPLGLPWLGAHLRLDALSAFFLGCSASAVARRASTRSATAGVEHEPHRVLPFYPAFLGAMALVLLADDAFTFLMCWEIVA